MNDAMGRELYEFCKQLFPICRSLTGNGVRQTLKLIQNKLPDLEIHEVATGTECFDWVVPKEWNIRDAYVMNEDGQKVIDFQANNLHVIGYSTPLDCFMDFEKLNNHLHSLPNQPDAIPYITSYYQERWGFCLAHQEREKLKPGRYRVVIDSTLKPGYLTYGELVLPGSDPREILLSSYICHPSMANNEISGPVVTTFLAQALAMNPSRRFTYRIVLVPETIGSILLLSRNLTAMKRNTIAGFVLTCVGDNRSYSFMPSRLGDTLADKVGLHVLKHHANNFRHYQFLDRGSDERQYCSVDVDLPVVSLMRTKYGEYPEYHTSLDNLDLISPDGLLGAYQAVSRCLTLLEANYRYKVNCLCEPQLGKRGLYPTLAEKDAINQVWLISNVLAYADGEHDLVDLADRIGVPFESCLEPIEKLVQAGLLVRQDFESKSARVKREGTKRLSPRPRGFELQNGRQIEPKKTGSTHGFLGSNPRLIRRDVVNQLGQSASQIPPMHDLVNKPML